MRMRQKMKKGMISVILAAAMALCLNACGGPEEPAGVETETLAAGDLDFKETENLSTGSETAAAPAETSVPFLPASTTTVFPLLPTREVPLVGGVSVIV